MDMRMSRYCTTFKICFGYVGPASRLFSIAFLAAMTLVIATSSITADAQTGATVTLTTGPSSVAYGSVVDMTWNVTAGKTAIPGGTVTFRDTYNNITEVLGTVQVQSANGTKGAAVLQHQLSGIGTHAVVATFNGTKTYSTGVSKTANVTVTGLYPTTGNLMTTGGGSGNWSLQATFVGTGNARLPPTGSVSLFDTSNSNLLLGTPTNLGAGTPGWQTVAGSTSPVGVGNHPQSVAVGDFNGDGYVDLAVLNSSDKTVSILEGDGKGGFIALSAKPATGKGPVAIVVGDFNGDGNLDLGIANSTDGTVSILLGNGNGTFNAQKTYSLPGVILATTSATSLVVGDFNGDGIADLAVVESATLDLLGSPVSGVVNIMLGDGTGAFPNSKVAQIPVGTLPSSVVVGDFNWDGNLDFAVANKSDNTISVMLGDGTGTTFTQALGSPIGTGTSPTAMAVADFNNDGVLDLAVVDSGQSQIGIYKGNGDGSFTLQTSAPATGTTPLSIVAGDFNSDGKIDLAVTNSGQSTASLLLGQGDLTFQPQTTASVGTTPSGITAGDFNGDGAIDLAVANSGSSNVSILLNQLTETASASFTGISIPGSGSSHLVDATYGGETNTYSTSTSNAVSPASFGHPEFHTASFG
jgi:hypothetical protein